VTDGWDFVLRFLIFCLLHSLLALRTLQRFMEHRIPWAFRSYRLAYNLIALVSFAWVMAAYPLSPVIYLVPGAGSLVFYGIQGVLLILLCRCAAQVGVSDFIGLRQLRGISAPQALVTTGCYAVVRHPQYTLALLFLLFNPVMSVRWLLLTVLSALYCTIGAYVEERRLEEDFGDEFRRYRERVPLFLPRLGWWNR